MSKVFWNALKPSPVLLGATLLVATYTQAAAVSAADLAPNPSIATSETLQIQPADSTLVAVNASTATTEVAPISPATQEIIE